MKFTSNGPAALASLGARIRRLTKRCATRRLRARQAGAAGTNAFTVAVSPREGAVGGTRRSHVGRRERAVDEGGLRRPGEPQLGALRKVRCAQRDAQRRGAVRGDVPARDVAVGRADPRGRARVGIRQVATDADVDSLGVRARVGDLHVRDRGRIRRGQADAHRKGGAGAEAFGTHRLGRNGRDRRAVGLRSDDGSGRQQQGCKRVAYVGHVDPSLGTHDARRFSRNAATPSRPSGEERRRAMRSAVSWMSWLVTGRALTARTSSFASRWPPGRREQGFDQLVSLASTSCSVGRKS